VRFLADENVPKAAVAALEGAGHDVVWVRSATPGAADTDILAAAARESRVLLTFDKDFGELAARSALPAGYGVILCRIPPPRSEPAGRRLAIRIGARDDWAGHFSVIEPGRIRTRRLL
jgi:hypothetical protein